MNIDAISIIGKSRYEHITSTLHAISKLPSMDGLEFEITVKDLTLLEPLDLIKIDYEDRIIYDITNDANIAYRYYPDSSIIERKIVLQKEDMTDTPLPLVFRYSKEDESKIADQFTLNETKKYIRKQRAVYKSTLPQLTDWRVEKTARFFADTPDSNKIRLPLDESNINTEQLYDIIDVEFEYTGESKNIIKSVSDLLSTLFPSMFKYLNITYGRISGIIKSDIAQLGQKVSIITQSMMNETDINRYTITEKIDGERALLVIFNGSIYVQTSKSFNLLVTFDASDSTDSPFNSRKIRSLVIADTECLNDTFYVFDILYNNGNPPEKYSDRIPLIDSFIVEYGDYINLRCLSSFTLKSWKAAVKYINENETSTVFRGVPIDGIILRDNNVLYKLKNKSHLTVDFLIRYNHLDDYCYLFTIGDPKEVITEIPYTDQSTKLLFGYHLAEKLNTNSAYILADFPYINSSYRIRLADHELYEGKVTEMLLTDDGEWIPIRIRHDKEYPNGYKIALSLYGLMDAQNDYDGSLTNEGHPDRNHILKRLYPTLINTRVRAAVLTSDPSVIDVFSNFHSTLSMLYIISNKSNTLSTVLTKLSAAKTFYNKDIKGIPFTQYHSVFNSLLSASESFYKQSLNYVIINDIYEYAPSYIDLYALCNFLNESVSVDGTIMIYFNLTYPTTKDTKQKTIDRMIGQYVGSRKSATWSFKVGSSVYHALVPDNGFYKIPFKNIIDGIDKIRSEISDNVIRYDNYLSVLRKYFTVTNTVLTEEYVVLSLVKPDD